ncbi:cation-translocating P-type ATPase [Natronomonas sp. F2-12]|jgi:Cu2+-exporting ATPase|uniref:Cation-translocating P-type ATPase n=1 Tax=Natronomonas aquatica TaxID=2841590 RepID=A0A9R1D641_9EURY|nr:heavy metal translocating P-type ATPase [Natronomonas aquatica]MCQ4332953.1 cation-translocating P-type ATPase [Natronomonas aquatica]
MSGCSLCDLELPTPPVTGEGVEGTFCCRGCLEVARTLEGADDVDDAPVSETREREIPEDAAEAYLAVDGMHCTTCETFLGLRGDDVEGVYALEANYAMETARVVYNPEAIARENLPGVLSGHGYTVRFREEDENGIDRDARKRQRDTVQRLVVGGFFTMLVMPWYFFYLYPSYVGIEPGLLAVDTTTPLTLYLPLVAMGLFASVVLFYTGYPVLRGAWVSVRTRQPNMDLLISVAALSAYGYSTVALATGSTHLYYDVSVAVIMVVTLGRYYEGRIRSQASDALSSVTAGRVREATRLTDDGRETVSVDDLAPDDRLVVAPGERVPVDGTVLEGTADVDESVLTGESLPVTKAPGDTVVGGSIVADDALLIEVEDTESTADRIATALWEIQSHAPAVQRLADALATVFVPAVLVLGAAVTLWGLLTGGTVAAALLAGLTVLVVSCPCAMGLATPLAVSGGLRDALQRRIVVTNESVFEVAPDADTLVFDKTGTLTAGEMYVTDVSGNGRTLELAAAVERFASHPVAEAILEAAASDGSESRSDVAADGGVAGDLAGADTAVGEVPEACDFVRHPGEGVAATVGERRVVAGTPGLLEERVGPVPDGLADRIEAVERDGGLPIVVGWDGRARGVITVADRERTEWEAAVESFEDREIVILTGDSGAGTERFRQHPAVDTVFTGVPPDGKVETVRRLAAGGTTVMVGDGTNDAPALAAADLGIAMGDGTARAIDAADVVVNDSDLTAVEDVFDLADGTRRRIRENILWAFLYNAVAIPLAVLGLINPLFAAVAMAASSLIVVTNSRRPVLE